MEEETFSSDNSADDLYFSALFDDEQGVFPISDEKYAFELQLQEALISSTISSQLHRKRPPAPSAEHEPEFKNKQEVVKRERGQSSNSFCAICMDAKPATDMFQNDNCTHEFCTDCIGKYIAAKIQENIINVECPDLKCKGVLDPNFCRPIVPNEVFERWENALCESMILGSQKFYCPYKDCSAMLVDDGSEKVTISECPHCRRLFCAQCKSSWHSGLTCNEFQSLKEYERGTEDILTIQLAKTKKWGRCPKCNFYVERTEGCMHISCRCGMEFCYSCGSRWRSSHTCDQV